MRTSKRLLAVAALVATDRQRVADDLIACGELLGKTPRAPAEYS